jgi:acetolactate synthase-1/2/3 large subunit
MTSSKSRVADYIWQRIAQEVDTVFFLPGGGCGPLVDSLGQSGLMAVSCLHEQGAGFAAVAYGQYRGLGVVLGTSGPGATNLMTPCLAAWVDSISVIFITGQVGTNWIAAPGMRCRGTQEAPTVEMVKPITKDAWLTNAPHILERPADLMYGLNKMIATAKERRPGPVWLDVPLDIQGAQYE